jgi:type II restriction/modification system DNA methylase subunit YeeA
MNQNTATHNYRRHLLLHGSIWMSIKLLGYTKTSFQKLRDEYERAMESACTEPPLLFVDYLPERLSNRKVTQEEIDDMKKVIKKFDGAKGNGS